MAYICEHCGSKMIRKKTDHPLYSTWTSMRQRCLKKTSTGYKNYGGRGIKICKRWDDFWKFIEDMGEKPTPKHSLDRINNNGHYSPENCRWATSVQQNANKRKRANSAKYTGVVANSQSKKNPWKARIGHNGKREIIGYFKTQEAASEAYNKRFNEIHKAHQDNKP